jgi:hypothetical protein
VSKTALTLSPVLVRVPPMRFTTVSKLTGSQQEFVKVSNWRGLPRFRPFGIVRAKADPQGQRSELRIPMFSRLCEYRAVSLWGLYAESMLGVTIDFTGPYSQPGLIA